MKPRPRLARLRQTLAGWHDRSRLITSARASAHAAAHGGDAMLGRVHTPDDEASASPPAPPAQGHDDEPELPLNRPGERYIQTILRRFLRHRLGTASALVLLAFAALALLAPLIAPYAERAVTGQFNAAPSRAHWLGTDPSSRDVFSRLLFGIRISLLVGFLVTLLSTVVGVLLGLISGYFGGVIDIVIMRITDIVMSFPYLLLVLVAAALLSPGLWTIILILGFVNWPGLARLVRGNVLALREASYVQGAIVAGMPRRHILFSEILPNTIAPVLVYATSVLSLSILDEAALSYLGQGVQTPTASLGNMLGGAESLTVLTERPWIWLPPGLMIIILVVAINFVGDALRDALDPSRTEQGVST